MANKSGTSSQVISLPKGGAALQGIGETFVPDLHTGTGNFTVPVALPAGRNSFQPELNLVYSTGNGNGPFGLGWSLSIPGVSRKTSRGVPRYDDSENTFVLSGAEDLVPIEEQPGAIQYLQDIVLVYDGNVEYWPNLGHGNWGKRIHMRNSPHFPYGQAGHRSQRQPYALYLHPIRTPGIHRPHGAARRKPRRFRPGTQYPLCVRLPGIRAT
ncbi:SpvB/TcaC N-terminal domain-containing protein [Nitrosococcus wardiae]|uniref:Virulence plasmid B protein n=1 Tax=Nitrosococcus wardiae TaxID=1814290 RepID=A0A4P7C0U9_9GAMM|nr:SpvB/TcaC N-terminal domain-containing protein [Nitrosococcus wardiae]QBQ55197.1 hypothetical protein E3U44_12265 [Nitrosococcus wardiae]